MPLMLSRDGTSFHNAVRLGVWAEQKWTGSLNQPYLPENRQTGTFWF